MGAKAQIVPLITFPLMLITCSKKIQEAPPVDVYMKFYVYHVLNPIEAQAGTAKPMVKEKGPYAYREERRQHNFYSVQNEN